MEAKATNAKAMKAKAMKAKATKAKATQTKAMKRPAATGIPRPTEENQAQPWDKLKMTRDAYMFWVTRGVDPSSVETSAPIMGAGFIA